VPAPAATVPHVIVYHWWNGSWGSMTRRDVWLETLDHGRFLIRWHGGAWRDRDGRYTTSSPAAAEAAIRALLVADQSWKEIAAATRRRPESR
jgi:hypothetical protein